MSLAEDAAEREQVRLSSLIPSAAESNPKQRLKSALWYSIGQYVDDSLLSDSLNATPQFIGALTELVYTQIGTSSSRITTFGRC
jgi:centromere protein S